MIFAVEEPCKLGCSGLKFCKSFNFRPTQPFRRCNTQADSAAEKDIMEWEKGNIKLPQMVIPVKGMEIDISTSQCHWKRQFYK